MTNQNLLQFCFLVYCFSGIYYSDEPGGKMLDGYAEFEDATTGDTTTKTKYGDGVLKRSDGTVIHYELNGIINLLQPTSANYNSSSTYATLYPNGAITGQISNQCIYKTHEDLMSLHPFKNTDEIAEKIITQNKNKLKPLKAHSISFHFRLCALLVGLPKRI